MVVRDLEKYWFCVQAYYKQAPEDRASFLINTLLPYINTGMHHRTRAALLRFAQVEGEKCA